MNARRCLHAIPDRARSVWIALSLLLVSGLAGAGDFCGTDCVLSEDFDDATDGGGVAVGALPAGWDNVSGENAGDTCVFDGFADPCFDWWVSSGVPEFAGSQSAIQPPFDHTDGLGNFLYVPSEDNDNATVSLLTPTFPLTAANEPYASFYIYAFDTGSSQPNQLNVDIMNAAGTSVVSPAVVTIGDTGISKWRPAFADLDGTPDGTYRLRFRWTSTLDQNDEGEIHDIAIDDFAIVADRQATGGEGGLAVRTHFLPAPEDDILAFLNETQGTAANPVETYTGISIALDNVIIYYDEQEDGYEGDIANPVQTGFVPGSTAPDPINRSTQVWGDGYPQNGYPPGHPDDILSLGEVIILREPEIDVTSLTAVLDHDAGDIIASSDEVAITRAFWAAGDETLNAGSIELFPTDRWGTEFVVPFGENITAADMDAAVSCGDDDIFEEVALFVMAESDGTQVTVDFNNGGGSNDFSTILDKGQSAFIGFNAGADGVDDINAGALVTATGLVQVHAFAADEGSNFGSRYYTLLPVEQLSDEYFAPFESSTGGDAELVIFNPNPGPVTVDVFTGANPATPVATFSLAGNDFDTFVLPSGTADGASVATRIVSRGREAIYAVVVMDACDDAHDWGGALLPDQVLTQAMLIPVGFGSDPTNAAVENHSPVWTTPAADTFVYVDFDGDLVPDLVDLNGDGDTLDVVDGIDEATSNAGMAVSELQLIRIHDATDFDQSGTLVFTLSSAGFTGGDPAGRAAGALIAGGWGQDPDVGGSGPTPLGAPAIDVGTAFAPITFPSTLPVSIASFESHDVAGGVEMRWTTVSETRNAGFRIWADKGDGIRLLTPDAIPSQPGDAATPRSYVHRIDGVRLADLADIAISAEDYHGKEELYGLFEPGRVYGSQGAPEPIGWFGIERDARTRMEARAARAAAPFAGAADVRPAAPGLVEIRYEELVQAGLNLGGVAVARIAVSLKGEPVPRHVVGADAGDGQPVFGPGAAIRFWSDQPALPDALYVDAYSYRIEEAPALARPAQSRIGEWTGFGDSFETSVTAQTAAGSHFAWQRIDADNAYGFASPLADPWYAARLRADRENAFATTFELDDARLTDQPGRLKVRLGGLTDYPAAPDHHALIEVNGVMLGEAFFDGARVHEFDLEVPAALLSSGQVTVTVRAPGGTSAPFDIFLLDTVELGYARRMQATGNQLHIEAHPSGQALEAAGFAPGPVAAYARADGDLYALGSNTLGAGQVGVAALDQTADYWLASADAMVPAASVTAVSSDNPLDGVQADFLVVAHPAFLPLSDGEAHPLNDYAAARRAEGWDVEVFDIQAVQQAYGWGMPLPQAITRFLAEADRRMSYTHVLLVGGDSYDYTDNLGLGSISFIPTVYAATNFIPHTPADALLADLDGDGLSDKALGRWPVRTIGDLTSIVTKTLDWRGMRGRNDAVWVTDSEDSRQSSFKAQAERMMEPLRAARWPDQALDRVFFDEVIPRPGLSVAEAARDDLFRKLRAGKALTGFVGHGAPSMWTFQGLLSPDDLTDLDNVGKPTMITTMTCYTSYFVSPNSDTVAHRWMNGYREDAFGQQVPGVANGAVAIHGAATLSSYDQNERISRDVLNQQLDGATLGQAIQVARQRARFLNMHDQVINWTLLGDPTLKLRVND